MCTKSVVHEITKSHTKCVHYFDVWSHIALWCLQKGNSCVGKIIQNMCKVLEIANTYIFPGSVYIFVQLEQGVQQYFDALL